MGDEPDPPTTTTTEVPEEPPVTLVPKPEGLYTPLYVMTGIFAAIFIFVPFLFRKGPNKGIIRYSIMIAAFSMWLFWVTVYIAQMNPLLGPRVKNTTLAWIGHKWGNDPKPAPPPEDPGTSTEDDVTAPGEPGG